MAPTEDLGHREKWADLSFSLPLPLSLSVSISPPISLPFLSSPRLSSPSRSLSPESMVPPLSDVKAVKGVWGFCQEHSVLAHTVQSHTHTYAHSVSESAPGSTGRHHTRVYSIPKPCIPHTFIKVRYQFIQIFCLLCNSIRTVRHRAQGTLAARLFTMPLYIERHD